MSDTLLNDEALMGLLKGIAARDETSYEIFCARVKGILSATIYKVLNQWEDSEDVCQEVLLKLWEKGDLYDPSKGRPLTWLRTMARNRAIDRLRGKQRRHDLMQRFRDQKQAVEPIHSRELSEEVSVREQAAMVRQAVIQLTPEQKQVVELAYFEGLTQSEIASRLDQPLGTVKARIRRGVNNLREQVKPTLLSAS